MGLWGSAMRGITVQPWPLRQKGNFGSFFTGPGPPSKGGSKSKLCAAHPILLDEKSGTPAGRLGAAVSAANASPPTRHAPTMPTTKPAIDEHLEVEHISATEVTL